MTKMKSFKIYTENKNEDYIKELLNVAFDGFTVIHTKGFWKGQEEDALCIEIFTDNATLIKAISKKIKHYNNQDAILITESEVKAVFIND